MLAELDELVAAEEATEVRPTLPEVPSEPLPEPSPEAGEPSPERSEDRPRRERQQERVALPA